MNEPEPLHPGSYIRLNVLPPDLTVTAAAKRLGVGRPALSNLLNGNASLSSDMAIRVEKAFGVDSTVLLRMQAAYDRARAQAREPEIAVRAYAPSVLDIKAIQIEAWSERIVVRSEFAAFLRRLVASTALGLTNIDFPAHENSQRHGWDGQVTVESATPWVPLGDSGWEFGVSGNPLQKAEQDYAARTVEVSAAARAKTTFIFVTPRNWPRKGDWVAGKRAQKAAWKDVRVYDASDLEQWMETSIPAQAWLAERMPLGGCDILDLDSGWRRWAEATQPEFSKALFKKSADLAARKLDSWLSGSSDAPFTVVAELADEALAALACAFETKPLAIKHAGERVVVVRTAAAMNKVVAASSSFIIVLASADAQREAASAHRQHPTIVVTHRNAVEGEPDLTVDLVDDGTFQEGLAAMGFTHQDYERYVHEFGSLADCPAASPCYTARATFATLGRRYGGRPAIDPPNVCWRMGHNFGS